MKYHFPNGRLWAAGIGFAALMALPLAAHATPTMDGEKDAEYKLVADSPKDNLLKDPNASPPIDDAADPRYKSLDVTGLWAANSGTDLYLYIELPYLDLNTIAGEWAVVFHTRGANDAISRTFGQDPYGASVDYNHYLSTPYGPNTVLKSNMLGFAQDYDGNQGWGALVLVNNAANNWYWPGTKNQMFMTNGGITKDVANNLMHGYGNDGGEVVYKGNKGIEVKIPLEFFGGDPAQTDLKAITPGDEIMMQFYDNVRERTTPNYPRGPIDCVPFEDSSRTPPDHGAIDMWASYTLTVPPVLEVSGVTLKDATDLNHVVLGFSSPVNDAGAVASNYTVTNVATGQTIPVSEAVIDSTTGKQVTLTFPIPYNTTTHIAVKNVASATGLTLSTTKNAADLPRYSGIQWNLYDPYGAISGVGINPDTQQPYKITVTGEPIGWRNDTNPATAGSNEIPMTLVTGETGHYQSAITLARPGQIGYKFRFPELPDAGAYDDWNGLNPKDKRGFVAASNDVVQLSDNASGTTFGVAHMGDPITATFTLVDRDNIAQGRPVYITGAMWQNWSSDPNIAWKLEPVTGQPNTYSVTLPVVDGWGRDTTTEYKYIMIVPNTSGGNDVLWDNLNPFGNRFVNFRATAGTNNAAILDVVSTSQSRMVRILRAVAGLDPVPQWSGYYNDQDADLSGKVDILDVVKAAHP